MSVVKRVIGIGVGILILLIGIWFVNRVSYENEYFEFEIFPVNFNMDIDSSQRIIREYEEFVDFIKGLTYGMGDEEYIYLGGVKKIENVRNILGLYDEYFFEENSLAFIHTSLPSLTRLEGDNRTVVSRGGREPRNITARRERDTVVVEDVRYEVRGAMSGGIFSNHLIVVEIPNDINDVEFLKTTRFRLSL